MIQNRRKYSPSFKTRVALEAIKGEETGSPHWKHSELFFEKKAFIPALQQLLASPL